MRLIIDTFKLWIEAITKTIGRKKDSELAEAVNGLTEEQKKKYRKQYTGIIITTLLLTFVYGGAIVELIAVGMSLVHITLVVIILKEIVTTLSYSAEEITLIEERMHRRAKKNKKVSQNKETETQK